MPGMLQNMGSQRVRHHLASEQQPQKCPQIACVCAKLLSQVQLCICVRMYLFGYQEAYNELGLKNSNN